MQSSNNPTGVTGRVHTPPVPNDTLRSLLGALAALTVTLPHALGLGLIAYAVTADKVLASSMALWAAALPGAFMTLFVRAPGVVYAPSTAVALLFGGMLELVMQAGAVAGITPLQALAITGGFVALAFVFQWLMGWAGLGGLSRFLPVSVTQGFSAGVGLSLILAQGRSAVGAGAWHWGATLAWHAAIAAGVVGVSALLQRWWPRFPALLSALVLVTVPVVLWAPTGAIVMAAQPHSLMLPPVPDWVQAPWWVVIHKNGLSLLSLALLMAVVNGLEVLVFHQQLETEHGVRTAPDAVLKKESVWGAVCAAMGMIPASTSTSRSRTALDYTGQPTVKVGHWHALALLVIALSGHLWLHWIPMAGLAGSLLVAGWRMVPERMWQRPVSPVQRVALWQSWLVAAFFALSGGVMALVAGMAVATLELLRNSAQHAIRRMHLNGHIRSRHVRREEVDVWLNQHMAKVAVFELQGIVSFGVAAWVVERIRQSLQGHNCVIVDAARVPSWDETGYARLLALGRDLHAQNIALLISGLRGWHQRAFDEVRCFEDLDRALEWAEERLLQEGGAVGVAPPGSSASGLGELGVGLEISACAALEACMRLVHYEGEALIIRKGERERALLLVQNGNVTLSTSEQAHKGVRLAVIGDGMVFGEMAFLNGIPRTAYAHAGPGGAWVNALDWEQFKMWSREHPDAATEFMKALARMGIRRLNETSQELRAVLE